MRGRTRRHEHSRALRDGIPGFETTSSIPLPTNQAVSLSSLGPFTLPIKQGDRKRKKNKLSKNLSNSENGSEIGLGLGLSNDPRVISSITDSDEESRSEETNFSSSPPSNIRNIAHADFDDWEGDKEKEIDTSSGKVATGRAVDPNETPTQVNLGFSSAPLPHQYPEYQYRQQTPHHYHHPPLHSSSTTSVNPYTTPTQATFGFVDHHPQASLNTPLRSRADSKGSSVDSAPVKGQNDYSLIQKSPESQAEFDAIMNNLGDTLFDVEEWDPELPSLPDPDASPERVAAKPQPLTYTTVGSVVKPTDTRQFTAPNRIQREGRAGLEIAARRPILSSTTSSRGQEFFPTRNTSQYTTTQSYSQVAAQNIMHEQSPVSQYQSSQHDRRSFAQGQSSTGAQLSQQAGGQNFAHDQHSTASHPLAQFGAPNLVQDQATCQGFVQQQQSSTGQIYDSHSASHYQSQIPRQTSTEQSLNTDGLTPQEEAVFKSLGLPLPMARQISREKDLLSNSARSLPQKLTPVQEEMLAQLQRHKPSERAGATPRVLAENNTPGVFIAQRPTLGMNQEAAVSASSNGSAARLQDAKMSTVQRLSQFPNPDQECAKARLAELAASKMRGNNENQRPGRVDQTKDLDHLISTQLRKETTMQLGISHGHDDRSGDGEVISRYHGNHAENELDYSFRFPNPKVNPLQQTYIPRGSSSYSTNTVVGPRKTPQGYPQPLTAGPPGQRQNTAPSSNKALNSMQQMLASGHQRNHNPHQQYGMPQHSMDSMPARPPYAPQAPSPQQSAAEPKIIPNPKTYPWAKLDLQPRDFTDGAPPRIRETLRYEAALMYYPKGMDMDTIRSFITTLPIEEAKKHYPAGMDESTKKWYEEEREWQQRPQSDLGLLLNGTIPVKEWQQSAFAFHFQNNLTAAHDPESKVSDPTDAWIHTGSKKSSRTNGQESADKPSENNGPGIIGQPRQSVQAKVDQRIGQKRFTVNEIKAMPVSLASETLLSNALSNLLKYNDKTLEGITNLQTRGFVPAPAYATGSRPNGNSGLFDSEWSQPSKKVDHDFKN